MRAKQRTAASVFILLGLIFVEAVCRAQAQPAQADSGGRLPVSVFVYDRTRADAWQWFAAPPASETYGYVESLVRLGLAQRIRRFDWELEVAQPSLLDLPKGAVSANAAQGQLGLGGTYYASNGSNAYPVAAFFKQGFLRYRFHGADNSLRVGRFEFFEGQETSPKDPAIAWLQANRVAQRLIGNFGFSNAQRSFDGVDGHFGAGRWDLTAMGARADQGVYNMNGNPEIGVDLQYVALTRREARDHLLWRAFAIDYHDARTGIAKTDNRPLSARQADRKNIRVGTYGGDLLAAIPAGARGGQFDVVLWGALQNGNWGALTHGANAFAAEGGYQLRGARTSPWLRAGWFRGSGDGNSADGKHGTFFQLLPTPRVYARFPFYNLMNSTDGFAQIVDQPTKKVAVRADLHWLRLTSAKDLWYVGGGAFDSKVFGYVGRPSNGRSSFASLADASLDWQATKALALDFYYARAWGKTAIGDTYPAGRDAQFGYVELLYRWDAAPRSKRHSRP